MPWHHLVVPFDGTSASAAAALHAEGIARQAGCRFSVLVFGGDASRTPESGHRVALTGIPSIEAPRWAEAHGADVIVLPGGAQQARESMAFIRRSAIPCLLVPVWQGRLTRLHVALDRTERGLQVLGPARSTAASLNAGIDYVSVAEAGDECQAATWLRERANVPREAIMVLTGPPMHALYSLMTAAHEAALVIGVRKGRSASVPESSGVGRSLILSAECAILAVPL